MDVRFHTLRGCVGDVSQPPRQFCILRRQDQASIRRDRVRVCGSDMSDEGEGIPDEPFADRLRIETCRVDARRTLQQRVERILQGEFQLLRSDREEQREDEVWRGRRVRTRR